MHLSRIVLTFGFVTLAATVAACQNVPQLDWPAATPLPLPEDLPLYWPDWSPDGKRVVVIGVAERNPDGQLMVSALDTGVYETPPIEMRYGEPHWSPDGNSLALYGWNALAIITWPNFESGPSLPGSSAEWAPAGDQLAIFEIGTTAPYNLPSRLLLTDLDGNVLRVLFEDVESYYVEYGGMAWSGANNTIAFSYGTREPDTQISSFHRSIHLADPATGETRLLIDSPVDKVSPSWSPDGEWLVYMAVTGIYPKGPGTITFTKADGSCTIAALSAEWLSGVDWSPDGDRLAVTHDSRLYIVDIVDTFGEAYDDLDSLCPNQ